MMNDKTFHIAHFICSNSLNSVRRFVSLWDETLTNHLVNRASSPISIVIIIDVVYFRFALLHFQWNDLMRRFGGTSFRITQSITNQQKSTARARHHRAFNDRTRPSQDVCRKPWKIHENSAEHVEELRRSISPHNPLMDGLKWAFCTETHRHIMASNTRQATNGVSQSADSFDAGDFWTRVWSNYVKLCELNACH